MKLVKSYKPLLAWLFLLIVGLTLLSVIGSKLEIGPKMASLLIMNASGLSVVGLMLIIYKTQRIYYINYVSFKEAAALSEEQRKRFAYLHLRAFAICMILYGGYTIISVLINAPMALDVIIFLASIIIAAIRTIPYSFELSKTKK